MIRVSCSRHNRVAASITWPAQTSYFDDADLTVEQLAELDADPVLRVERIADPAPEATPKSRRGSAPSPATEESPQ